MQVSDQSDAVFNDSGTDILGASDSILAGSDTYSITTDRNVSSTMAQNSTASPTYALVWGWDNNTLTDSGSSTLTSTGHVYATDYFTYKESSSDSDTMADTLGTQGLGSGSIRQGGGADSYADVDIGTMTHSDTVTTSFDSFALFSSQSVSAEFVSWSEGASNTGYGFTDEGKESSSTSASGVHAIPGNDSYTFLTNESM